MSEQKSSIERDILQGYVVNVEFDGLYVPATMQNLMIRDYAKRNGLKLRISVGEYCFPGCTLQLDNIVKKLPEVEGIAMCIMFMLPKDDTKRQQLYDKVIAAAAALHLLLENIVVRSAEDAERVEEILYLNRMIRGAPQHIPKDILPSCHEIDSFT